MNNYESKEYLNFFLEFKVRIKVSNYEKGVLLIESSQSCTKTYINLIYLNMVHSSDNRTLSVYDPIQLRYHLVLM